MAPKKKPNAPSTKTDQKQKAKVVEDKTFGLKNKKGNKQQKFIQTVEKTVLHGSRTAKELQKLKDDKEAKKLTKKQEADELNSLFRPVEQKIAKGADPKSVLCAFFKAGQCGKKDKCKFSHDLNVQRKGEKKNVFDNDEGKEDTMEDWDEARLEEVVNKKHGESNKTKMETKIICKFFLDSVENNKYGWFWDCPNGKGCHYKHALPPGFELKKDRKKEDKGDQISLEELVEKERAALNSDNLTKVTLESFLIWKEKKRKEKLKMLAKSKSDKKKNLKAGIHLGAISGRELFEFNPDLVVDEDDEGEGEGMDLSKFKRDSDDEEGEDGVEINIEDLAAAARQADDSGTKRGAVPKSNPAAPLVNGVVSEKPAKNHDEETSKLDMAAGGATSNDPGLDPTAAAIASATSAIADIAIDEDLFDGDDLFEVEEELENLDLND